MGNTITLVQLTITASSRYVPASITHTNCPGSKLSANLREVLNLAISEIKREPSHPNLDARAKPAVPPPKNRLGLVPRWSWALTNDDVRETDGIFGYSTTLQVEFDVLTRLSGVLLSRMVRHGEVCR